MSQTTPEEALQRATKHRINLMYSSDFVKLAALIDEVRGVDAEPVPALLRFNELRGDDYESPLERLRFFCSLAMSGQDWLDVEPFLDALYTHPAPSQPAAMVNLAAETPTQKGARATLAVQGLSKAFDGLGSGRKDRKMKVTDEMVNRFLMWKLPAGFAPDCGISFKSESDYEHPVFGRSKHEPMGTNLFSADQARAMLEHVLADIQPAAPVELPVVGVISAYAIPTSDKPYADEILVQRSRQIEGPPLWAVRLNGDCLNKSGEWEWEPMPSSRDDEFLERCRFPTAQEAIDAAIAAGRKAS